MMCAMTESESFTTFRLRPHWLQYIIDQLPWLVICCCGFLIAGDEELPYRQFVLYAAIGFLVYLIYQAIDFARIEYIVTGEQLVFKHGVLFHSSDYMELYRVVDYQENRSPMQQLTGLKSVTLLSGDRSLPKLTLRGIRGSSRIIDQIRIRVEYNKKRRGIYEITNRF